MRALYFKSSGSEAGGTIMNRRIAISAWAHALVLPGIALGASKVEQQAEVRKAAQDALNGLYKAQPLRT